MNIFSFLSASISQFPAAVILLSIVLFSEGSLLDKLGLAFLCTILVFVFRYQAIRFSSIREKNELDQYLDELLEKKILIKKLSHNRFLNKEQIDYLKKQQGKLGHIYEPIVYSLVSKKYPTQHKAFSLPDQFKKSYANTLGFSDIIKNNATKLDKISSNQSIIFAGRDLNSSIDYDRFTLFHEIGHTTVMCMSIISLRARMLMSCCLLLIFSLTCVNFENIVTNVIFLLVIIILLALSYNPILLFRKEEFEESYCDLIAMELLRLGGKFEGNILFRKQKLIIDSEFRLNQIRKSLNYNKKNRDGLLKKYFINHKRSLLVLLGVFFLIGYVFSYGISIFFSWWYFIVIPFWNMINWAYYDFEDIDTDIITLKLDSLLISGPDENNNIRNTL